MATIDNKGRVLWLWRPGREPVSVPLDGVPRSVSWTLQDITQGERGGDVLGQPQFTYVAGPALLACTSSPDGRDEKVLARLDATALAAGLSRDGRTLVVVEGVPGEDFATALHARLIDPATRRVSVLDINQPWYAEYPVIGASSADVLVVGRTLWFPDRPPVPLSPRDKGPLGQVSLGRAISPGGNMLAMAILAPDEEYAPGLRTLDLVLVDVPSLAVRWRVRAPV